jgi:hypothetical protein
MFKDTNSYHKAIERITFLQSLEEDDRITAEDAYELDELIIAVEMYEDVLDAEAEAEHNFLRKFEESFVASMKE